MRENELFTFDEEYLEIIRKDIIRYGLPDCMISRVAFRLSKIN